MYILRKIIPFDKKREKVREKISDEIIKKLNPSSKINLKQDSFNTIK